jgi:lysophospholipase L1-like esterase
MRWWRVFVTVATCALLVGASTVPVAARDGERDDAEYLALGDSVAFGYNPLLDRRDATNFVGYPEALARRLEMNVTNASCPGEASGGFISLTGIDNSCRPYRGAFPLHTSYSTSQLDFAVSFLRSHRHVKLVTINIGANDLFVLQKACAGVTSCVISGLPTLLNTLSTNLATIYGRLRGEAHYQHELVALTYYATDYRDPVGVSVLGAINSVVAQATIAANGRVADGFGAFGILAATAGGDTCAAGLLIPIPAQPGKCDIHPSPLGHEVLAQAVARVLRDPDDDRDNQAPRPGRITNRR